MFDNRKIVDQVGNIGYGGKELKKNVATWIDNTMHVFATQLWTYTTQNNHI